MTKEKFIIGNVAEAEYPALVVLWESSVRATHHFLEKDDILFYRDLVATTALQSVTLRCARDHAQHIAGFIGVSAGHLEMLYIHPELRRKGVGKLLLHHALDNMAVQYVDVNEANKQALGFYEHFGFKIIGRSALDGTGKAYPILHLAL